MILTCVEGPGESFKTIAINYIVLYFYKTFYKMIKSAINLFLPLGKYKEIPLNQIPSPFLKYMSVSHKWENHTNLLKQQQLVICSICHCMIELGLEYD